MISVMEDVKHKLMESVRTDNIVLPTLPEIALRVREAADDDDISIRGLADLIGSDAALTARIIQVANSPMARGINSIDNLPAAISRLGMTYSCNLAVGLAMRQLFQATNDKIDRRMREVWSHSAEVAAISNVLAKHYTRLESDQATLAGLTHQIGMLPILTYAQEHHIFLKDEESSDLDTLIDSLHPQIGELILRTWKFPEFLVTIPTTHLDLHRTSAKVDLADVVIVAKLQSYSGTQHPLASVDWSTVPAFTRLGLGTDMEAHDVEDLSAEMNAAIECLK